MSRWSPRSLRRRLAIGVCAIVAAAVLAVGAVAEMGLRNEMLNLINSQVNNSLSAFSYSYAKAKLAVAKPGEDAPGAADLGPFPGQPPGTVIVDPEAKTRGATILPVRSSSRIGKM